MTLGTIKVTFKINQQEVMLNEDDLNTIKQFHFTVFDGVLKILQHFLVFDISCEAEVILLVPVNKNTQQIDFDILKRQFVIKSILELTNEEKQQLNVTTETFLKTIVVPWYKVSNPYIVTEVCQNKSALSPFPNEDFGSYKDYFFDKYNRFIFCPQLPLLLVKGLTKRMNFIKPVGSQTKKKHEQRYEEMTEHLLPELVVKQDFPADLWIQANLLPTILYRFSYLLQLEDLRCKIVEEAGLGKIDLSFQPPLVTNEPLVEDEVCDEDIQENIDLDDAVMPDEKELNAPPATLHMNKDFSVKLLEAEFPWKNLEEPKNIFKSLDVSLMEIEHYDSFVHTVIDKKENYHLKNDCLNRPLAITFPIDYVPKKIGLLQITSINEGPNLRDLFCAMTCAKADELMNLERLETLGDSFLKLIASLYTTLRFPTFNEGMAAQLKDRLVSNKNLFYLAKKKNLAGIMKLLKLSPKDDWLPPAFKTPDELTIRILKKEISINTLHPVTISPEEQLSGVLNSETVNDIMDKKIIPDETEDASYRNLASFLKLQYVGDKFVADTVESLLGCYLQICGFQGKFIGVYSTTIHQCVNYYPRYYRSLLVSWHYSRVGALNFKNLHDMRDTTCESFFTRYERYHARKFVLSRVSPSLFFLFLPFFRL